MLQSDSLIVKARLNTFDICLTIRSVMNSNRTYNGLFVTKPRRQLRTRIAEKYMSVLLFFVCTFGYNYEMLHEHICAWMRVCRQMCYCVLYRVHRNVHLKYFVCGTTSVMLSRILCLYFSLLYLYRLLFCTQEIIWGCHMHLPYTKHIGILFNKRKEYLFLCTIRQR